MTEPGGAAPKRPSRAGLETLARIHAVGTCTWLPGAYPMAYLNDAWMNTLHSTTISTLVRDGYLVDAGRENLLEASELARTALARVPELTSRAHDFYQAQAVLAAQRVRMASDKPDFKGERPAANDGPPTS